jgi:flagellar L-ring protein precursor FlgH
MERREGKRLKIKLLVLIVLLFSTNLTALGSNSLWSDKAASLYQDQEITFELGDVITVIIEEDTDAVQSANTSVSQDSNISAGPGLGIFDFIKNFGLNYADKDGAEGETARSGQIRGDITTLITEVYSNGNFKIVGTKTIKINGEEQVIRLSGIIRPEDITEENTITSKKVADASIEFEGQGVITAKQQPNIFQRILNWLF